MKTRFEYKFDVDFNQEVIDKRVKLHSDTLIRDINMLSAKEDGIIKDYDLNGKYGTAIMDEEGYVNLLRDLGIFESARVYQLK